MSNDYDMMHKRFDYPPKVEPLIVGICGWKGHGKDTAAEAIIKQFGFKKISFADGLRKTVCTALRVPESYFLDPATKEDLDPRTGKSRRYWLQWIGTQGFRALWEDVWVEWWRGEIIQKRYDRVVVTDLRFPNEMEVVRQMGGFVIRILNPNKEDSGDRHDSEIHQEHFDVDLTIYNDDSVETLHERIKSAVAARYGFYDVEGYPA